MKPGSNSTLATGLSRTKPARVISASTGAARNYDDNFGFLFESGT